jgi:hypothetical protein
MSRHSWSADEVEMLLHLAGDRPSDRLARDFNAWAKSEGYATRTERSIIVAVNRRGCSYRAVGEWVTTGYIAAAMGCSSRKVLSWIHRGMVHSHRRACGQNYIRRSDLVTLARRHPEVMAGASRDQLWILLEDEHLADSIAAHYPRHHSQPRPVLAVEIRQQFPSISRAAALVFVTPPAIRRAIRTGGTAAGYHWTHA